MVISHQFRSLQLIAVALAVSTVLTGSAIASPDSSTVGATSLTPALDTLVFRTTLRIRSGGPSPSLSAPVPLPERMSPPLTATERAAERALRTALACLGRVPDRTLLGRLIGSQPLPQFGALIRQAPLYTESSDTLVSLMAEWRRTTAQSSAAVSSCSIEQFPEELGVYGDYQVDPEFILGHAPVLADSAFLTSHGYTVARTTHLAVDFRLLLELPRLQSRIGTTPQLTRLVLASLAGLEQVLRQIYLAPAPHGLISTQDPWQFADSTMIASRNMP